MFKDTSNDNEIIEYCEDLTSVAVSTPENQTFKPSRYQASYIWWLGQKNGLIGKASPSTSKGVGSREKLTYECLVPDTVAVSEINHAMRRVMPPISVEIWKGICKRFRHQPSPYKPPLQDEQKSE